MTCVVADALVNNQTAKLTGDGDVTHRANVSGRRGLHARTTVDVTEPSVQLAYPGSGLLLLWLRSSQR